MGLFSRLFGRFARAEAAGIVTKPAPVDSLYHDLVSARAEAEFDRPSSFEIYTKLIRKSTSLYRFNPIAKAVVDTVAAFMVGRGLTVSPGEEFYPGDGWALTVARTLCIYGEVCYAVYDADTFGFIHSSRISEVGVDDFGPYAIVLAEQETTEENVVSLYDRDPDSATIYQQMDIPFPTAERGNGLLFPVLDIADLFVDVLQAAARQEKALATFAWDVTLEGYSEEQVRNWVARTPVPAYNAILAHNEMVTWTPITASVNGGNVREVVRVLRDSILSAAGIPIHWIAEGEINRATAAEMNLPTLQRLRARQHALTEFVRRFVQRRASFAGQDISPRVTVDTTDLRDIGTISGSLNNLVAALVAAQGAGIVDNQVSNDVVNQVLEVLR